MRIKRILLDLDDVCNTFTISALMHVGCSIPSVYPDVGYDIIAACNLLHPTKTWTAREFWEAIPRCLWAETPLSKEYFFILSSAAKLVGTENIFIATSPTKDPDCLAGKLEWIHDNMPSYLHRQYIITPRKWLCANEYTLLIDDSDENVKQFKQAGGQAVLVPRPWNALRNVNTIDYLKERLKEVDA